MNTYYTNLWPLPGIVWVLFWIILGLVMSRIGWGRRRWSRDINKSALDILKERYAKGEIEKTKFDEMKRDL